MNGLRWATSVAGLLAAFTLSAHADAQCRFNGNNYATYDDAVVALKALRPGFVFDRDQFVGDYKWSIWRQANYPAIVNTGPAQWYCYWDEVATQMTPQIGYAGKYFLFNGSATPEAACPRCQLSSSAFYPGDKAGVTTLPYKPMDGASGFCSQSGGFGAQEVYARCQCPANTGWYQTKIDGTCDCYPPDEQMITCPYCADANAIWTGNQCTCKAGYVLQNGVCISTCTQAKCDANCAATSASLPLPTVKLENESALVSCPGIFGGDTGLKLSGAVAVSAQPSSCAGGCVAKQTVKLQGEATFTPCGGPGFGVKIAVDSESKVTTAKACISDAVCETVCRPDLGRCEETKLAASFAGGPAWSWGVNMNRFVKGGDAWPLKFVCKADGSVLVGGTATAETSQATGGYAGVCPACEQITAGPTIEGKLQGGCSLEWGPQRTKVSLALGAEYKQAITVTSKKGCGGPDATCMTSSLSASAKAQGAECFNLFGRRVKVAGQASFGGTCSGSSCSGATSGCDWQPNVTTTVTAGICKN